MRLVFYIFLLNSFLIADILDNIKSGLSTGIMYAKEKTEIAPIKAEIISIEMDLDRAYKVIGKKYVEYASKNHHEDIGVNNLLLTLKPLKEKKKDLEEEILKINRKYDTNNNFNDEIDRLETK